MEIELKGVAVKEKEILNNLLEKYNYEFSQYDKIPFDENGLFHYRYLDNYWTDPDRHAYFIVAEDKLAGFVLINKHPECNRPIDWAIAEFFVSYNYRRSGVGTTVVNKLFDQYKGYWHIKYHPNNIASALFWNKIASRASNGNYETLRGDEDYFDGTEAKVLFFKN
jgi:predicted acetyltransferase